VHSAYLLSLLRASQLLRYVPADERHLAVVTGRQRAEWCGSLLPIGIKAFLLAMTSIPTLGSTQHSIQRAEKNQVFPKDDFVWSSTLAVTLQMNKFKKRYLHMCTSFVLPLVDNQGTGFSF
jgi:hypothetical protein